MYAVWSDAHFGRDYSWNTGLTLYCFHPAFADIYCIPSTYISWHSLCFRLQPWHSPVKELCFSCSPAQRHEATLQMWLKGCWGHSELPLSKLVMSVLAGCWCWQCKVDEYHGPLKWSDLNGDLLGTWNQCRIRLRNRGSGNEGTSVPEGKEGVRHRNSKHAAKVCETEPRGGLPQIPLFHAQQS